MLAPKTAPMPSSDSPPETPSSASDPTAAASAATNDPRATSPSSDTSDRQPPAKSLRDFDYFAEEHLFEPDVSKSVPAAEEQQSLDGQLRHFHRQRKRYGRAFTLMLLTLALVLWAFSGWAPELVYDFSVDPTPIDMGDAAEHRADDYPHNAFVRVRGITEHRGLRRSLVRGIGLPEEYRYFRLVGSQGVFIEVSKDNEASAPMTKVDVVGRVIDPVADSSYQPVIDLYHHEFLAKRRPTLRFIQVDRHPGTTRTGFLVVAIVVMLLLVSNILTLVRLLRAHRNVAGARVRGSPVLD